MVVKGGMIGQAHTEGAAIAALGPALRQLFAALDQFKSGQRSDFENDLHAELLQVAMMLGAAQRAVAPMHGTLAIESWSTDRIGKSIVTPGMTVDIGTGAVPITLGTRCSEPKCPNKRDK